MDGSALRGLSERPNMTRPHGLQLNKALHMPLPTLVSLLCQYSDLVTGSHQALVYVWLHGSWPIAWPPNCMAALKLYLGHCRLERCIGEARHQTHSPASPLAHCPVAQSQHRCPPLKRVYSPAGLRLFGGPCESVSRRCAMTGVQPTIWQEVNHLHWTWLLNPDPVDLLSCRPHLTV